MAELVLKGHPNIEYVPSICYASAVVNALSPTSRLLVSTVSIRRRTAGWFVEAVHSRRAVTISQDQSSADNIVVHWGESLQFSLTTNIPNRLGQSVLFPLSGIEDAAAWIDQFLETGATARLPNRKI